MYRDWTGIPAGTQLTEEESERLLHMEQILHERIVGQDEAVTAVARAIRRGRVGLKDPETPDRFLPLPRPDRRWQDRAVQDAWPRRCSATENAMIRMDMSEYMEKHTVSRLVGSPPGYVGYDEGGQLTEQVRRQSLQRAAVR